MHSILIGDPNSIGRVYSEQTLNHLMTEVGLSPQVITHTMLKEGLVETAHVECLFSTWGMPALSEEEIARYFPNLRALFYAAGSVKGFAAPFLECGVKISSAYAANAIPVAEYTVSQILLATKGFFRSSALYSRGEISKSRQVAAAYPGNFGIRVGLIGAGMVGKVGS